jgi:hypothetical protein
MFGLDMWIKGKEELTVSEFIICVTCLVKYRLVEIYLRNGRETSEFCPISVLRNEVD